MSGVAITLFGDKEIRRKLLAMKKGAARKIISQGLREGAKIVADRARIEVPKRSGELQRSIRVRVGKYTRGGKRIQMLAQTGEGFFRGPQYYGGFVHLGHAIVPHANVQKRGLEDKPRTTARRTAGQGIRLGRVPPDPFLRRAGDMVEQQVKLRVEQRIRNGVIAEMFKA